MIISELVRGLDRGHYLQPHVVRGSQFDKPDHLGCHYLGGTHTPVQRGLVHNDTDVGWISPVQHSLLTLYAARQPGVDNCVGSGGMAGQHDPRVTYKFLPIILQVNLRPAS